MVFWLGLDDSYGAPKILLLLPWLWWTQKAFKAPGQELPHLTRRLAVGLILWAGLTALAAHHPGWMLAGVAYASVFATAIFCAPLEWSARQTLRSWLMTTACLNAAYGLLQVTHLDPLKLDTAGQATAFIGNPNLLAGFLLCAIWLGAWPNPKWCALGRCFLMLALVACQSRAALLGLALWLLMQAQNQRLLKIAIVTMLLAAIATALYHRTDIRQLADYARNPQTYTQQLAQQPYEQADRQPWFRGKRLSLMVRLTLWHNSWDLMWQPLPAGPGQFTVAYAAHPKPWADPWMNRETRARSAHNWIMDSTIAFGLIWTIACCFFLISLWRTSADRTWSAWLLTLVGLSLLDRYYLEPMTIITTLLLFAPSPKVATHPATQPSPRKWITRTAQYLLASVALTSTAHHIYNSQLATGNPNQIPTYLAQKKAKAHWQHNQIQAALQHQIQAYRQDPGGPETLQNLAIISQAAATQLQSPQLEEIAKKADQLNRAQNPYYHPQADSPYEILTPRIAPEDYAPQKIKQLKAELDHLVSSTQ